MEESITVPEAATKKWYRSPYALMFLGVVMVVSGVGITRYNPEVDQVSSDALGNKSVETVTSEDVLSSKSTEDVVFVPSEIAIAPTIREDFSISEIENIDDIEQAYGFTFTASERAQLEAHKFVVKNLLDTNLSHVIVEDTGREFVGLYKNITGQSDYKARTPANAVYISSDVLMNLFSILSVDLLKEAENQYIYPDLLSLSKTLYTKAGERLASAQTDNDRSVWTKVRNYFAVPYALLSTAQVPVTPAEQWLSGETTMPSGNDDLTDSYDAVSKTVNTFGLDAQSEQVVLTDIKKIYTAADRDLPLLFSEEYSKIAGIIEFQVPFSLFTPRGSYTSSSLRRQYFRSIQWYQQIPFFVKSSELTEYALHIGELVASEPDILYSYERMNALLELLVGESDDLEVGDYVAAINEMGGSAYTESEKLSQFLYMQKPAARIKSMPATYDGVGIVSREDVITATRGMRFVSQKFIPDSYWTGMLTQGDEKPDVQGMQLPRDTSSLMVMHILGSTHAQSSLTHLPFYKDYKEAIDRRLNELATEANGWSETYWRSNQVTNILWTIQGLFGWQKKEKEALPRFMQSPLWDAKTLVTSSGLWTEMRHTNILYAKQSFAEKGGGGDEECDVRKVPSPVVGYVEPQVEAYDRLEYAARKLVQAYETRGYKLSNLPKLEQFVVLMGIVKEYTKLQLENTRFDEPTIDKEMPEEYFGPGCVSHFIDPKVAVHREVTEGEYSLLNQAFTADNKWVAAVSRPEELRREIVRYMEQILPYPVEGPVIPIKDKRTALIADVHTSDNGKLEEGIGVPRVLFVAVKDANGPRLTVGFMYSHYEFLSPDRLTDEVWQEQFYTDEGGEYVITYKDKAEWPTLPIWYQSLLGTH